MEKAIIITKVGIVSQEIFSCEWSIKRLWPNHFDYNSKTILDEYTPKKGDNIYFFPGCTVPRLKVRDWAKREDVKLTTKIDKAQIFVLPDNVIDKLKTFIGGKKLPREYAKKFFIDNKYTVDSELISALNDPDVGTVQFQLEYKYYGDLGFHKVYNPTLAKSVYRSNLLMPVYKLGEDIVTNKGVLCIKHDKAYDKYVSHQGSFYSQQSITRNVSSDSAVLTEEMYENLARMLQGSTEDKTVAIEAMASCDYDKSAHFLLLLIKDYWSKMKDAPASKHVNFKGLLRHFGLTNDPHLNFTKVTNTLIDRNLLTLESVKFLAEYIREYINRAAWDKGPFMIHQLTVNDEVTKMLTEKQEKEKQVEPA